ncbi:hypothetical protein K493DRAFT_47722 [Basidiobolus meristosporus CBS 931.73]|uniref:RING-type E3 ubiquitin transferase n=1 Tax=Basidiobolus meristosporus CBS 931.73 TaxID=1314790 RepID=A0A1Y1Y1L4_9FUNG|nr:hypothetical protein K493DRAFT_47722 [Basidiobolus meristosporus CBS 931.73]|eukprot:ORX91900.1 hypothetical protein K493DRAFT_47722 [Basidiobolus meristosporus CBS 931.73]
MKLIQTDLQDENGVTGIRYSLQFKFDSLYPCRIKLYWCAKEIWEDGEASVRYHLKYPSQTLQTYEFPKGLNQNFSLPSDQLLNVTKFQPDDLVMNTPKNMDSPKPESHQGSESDVEVEIKEPVLDSIVIEDGASSASQSSEYYPLIIVLEAVTSDDTVPDVLSTFATLTVNSSGVYDTQPLKQKIKMNGASFILQEIYGYSESSPHPDTSDTNESNSARECVICMSDPRDTTVLPCRHMCLCKECAEVLRCQSSKCPICRQPFHSLLHIGPSEEGA